MPNLIFGTDTQAPVLCEAAETLRLDYAQFLELEIFTRFGGVIDAQVKDAMHKGVDWVSLDTPVSELAKLMP